MKNFIHINAKSVDEAASSLKKYDGRAKVMAGGTDLLGQMKDEILPEYPEVVVNLKSIQNMDYIKEDGGILKIGALTRLADIAENNLVKQKYTALAEAAGRVASAHIREMGTISGNICQGIRCWYYRNPDNRFDCIRKGGKLCNAATGDNRYHSIFGGMKIDNPSCSSNCPAGINIPSYMEQIRDGNIVEAAKIMMKSNPLLAITGRVCPHNCEKNCNRGEFDESVGINAVERYMGDYILDKSSEFVKAPAIESGKSVAVVGSGPAGLSAAYYLRKLGHRVTVYDRMEKAGGLLVYGIPAYRLPKDIVEKQINILKNIGVEFKLKVNVGKDMTTKDLMKSANAVLLACGAWKEKAAGIKGEELLKPGLEFLKNVGLGDKKVPGKDVAVIGGGNVALDVARTLLRMGAKPAIIYRRTEAEMPGIREDVEKAKEDGIKFEFLTLPVEAKANGNKIALKCAKMKLGPPDASGRPSPIAIKGSDFTTDYDVVFKAIGETPDTSYVPAEFLDQKGQLKIEAAEYYVGTNLFAGGDFTTGPATVVQAIAAGRKAAESISRYFKDPVKQADDKKETVKTPLKFNSSYFIKSSSIKRAELSISERVKSIDIEEVFGLKSDEIAKEANRCFNCGCLAVNPSDVAPALVALNAKIKTTKRDIEAERFFTAEKEKSTILEDAEIVTEIQVPVPNAGIKSKFIKFTLRKAIDFPIVNCASAIETSGGVVKKARICLNAVYNQPYRVKEAENFLIGKKIDDLTADDSGKLFVADACSLTKNKYMIQIAKTLVKRTILACE